MTKMGNLDANIVDYNLYTNLGGYFKLSFVITEVRNLDVK